MPYGFESIVRPFETRDVAPARRVKTSETDGSNNLRMELGRNSSAGAQVLITTYSASVKRYMTKQEREVKTEDGA